MTDENSFSRTSNVWMQVKSGVAFKAVGLATSFITMPIIINYLGKELFGVWTILFSILSWAIFFDLGIGNGLRNKVAISLANNSIKKANLYISSAYTIVGFISLSAIVLIYVIAHFVSWQHVFNTTKISEDVLRQTFIIMSIFVLSNFWLGLISPLLGSIQKSSYVEIGRFITNLILLAAVLILSKNSVASIKTLAYCYGGALIFGHIMLSCYFFTKRPELIPKFRLSWFSTRPLLSLGFQFFIIQVAGLILFTTDKILITQLFGLEYVTDYEVVFRLFSIIIIFHSMLMMPLWSAYTDAYQKNDVNWLKKTVTKQVKIFLPLVVLVAIMITSSGMLLKMWIGEWLQPSPGVIFWMGIFVIFSCWNNIFAFFVNGLGLIKIQLLTTIVAISINLPLSIYLAKYTNLGVSSIIIGTIVGLSVAAIVLPIQVKYILKNLESKNKTIFKKGE